MTGDALGPAGRVPARILLDSPSLEPALNFTETAAALAHVIEDSRARFSVGIFGGWGSGKTTLMRAIQRALPDESIVKVEFNAWRFEREPLLLVPLLDTIRSALLAWSRTAPAENRERVRSVARRVGRVVRALASGLSGEVGVGGMARVSYDVGRAVDALAVDDDTDRPQSLYVAAFRELEEAFEQFGQKGARRVVVFVDDLDRCLPANALDVLESMKLFFDLEGFVFVVGLDEAVVQRAVRARFADPAPRTGQVEPAAEPAPGGRVDEKLERDYVEKIFQVPYRLPAMVDRQLGDLLEAMYGEAGLPPSQADDFRDRVARYLAFVAVQGQVNPREVKRFLNTYTLQTLVRPELDRDTVLALQTLLFRADWRALYDAILADSPRFVATLTRYRDERDERAFEDLSPELAVLRPDLAEFLTSDPAAALSRHQSLDAYLSSLESTRVTTPPWLTAAYQELGRLRAETRRTLRLPEPDDADRVRLAGLCREVSSRLFSLTADTPSASVAETAAAGVTTLIGQLEAAGAELESLSATPERFRERLAEIADRLLATADRLYRALRTFR